MRKTIIMLIFISLLFVGCGSNKSPVENIESTTENITDTFNNDSSIVIEPDDIPYMLMFDGNMYYDTGETNSSPRCGVMDFTLTYTGALENYPTENGQANFETDGGQSTWCENKVEVLIDEEWHVFACNFNSVNVATMKVTSNTDTSLELEITNPNNLELETGERYVLEKKDSETDEWHILSPIVENYGFTDIAYILPKDEPYVTTIDFEWLYGKLESGEYRISKEIHRYEDSDSFDGKYEVYWYNAKFVVK